MIGLLARLLIKPVLTTTLAVFGSPDGLLAQEGPALQPPAPQSPPPQPAPATTFPALPAQGATPVQQQTVTQSNAELVVTLIRTSLVAVQQASATGNFTVLRDLGAPDFRERNSAADLARIFGVVREQRIDLSPAVLLDPQLSRAELRSDNMLHVAGALATRPLPITFEFLFQPIAGLWRIYGISITPAQPAPAFGSPAPVATAPPAQPAARADRRGSQNEIPPPRPRRLPPRPAEPVQD